MECIPNMHSPNNLIPVGKLGSQNSVCARALTGPKLGWAVGWECVRANTFLSITSMQQFPPSNFSVITTSSPSKTDELVCCKSSLKTQGENAKWTVLGYFLSSAVATADMAPVHFVFFLINFSVRWIFYKWIVSVFKLFWLYDNGWNQFEFIHLLLFLLYFIRIWRTTYSYYNVMDEAKFNYLNNSQFSCF